LISFSKKKKAGITIYIFKGMLASFTGHNFGKTPGKTISDFQAADAGIFL
jgi:hypothetical protein